MKKMKTKRLLAVLLTLAMVLGMTTMAFAAPDDETPDEKEYSTSFTTTNEVTTPTPSAITIVKEGVDGEVTDRAPLFVGGLATADITATAYPIVQAKYEHGGKFSGYYSLYPRVENPIEITGSAVNITEAQLTEILAEIKDGKIVPGVDGEGGHTATIDNGTATWESLPIGSYLVVITGAGGTIYSPIVVSSYYVNEQGGNAIEAVGILDIASEKAWVKVTEPKVNKYIVENGTDIKGNSVTVGDTVNYKIDVTPIPEYKNPDPDATVVTPASFRLVDTLDNGLDRQTDLEKIKVSIVNAEGASVAGLTYGTDFTVSESENKKEITIDFVVDNQYKLNNYANIPGYKIVVEYEATVNEKATLNQDANTNDVTLIYSKHPSIFGENGEDKDTVYSYTFDLDGGLKGDSITKKVINKIDGEVVEGVTPAALAGAEFTLYTEAVSEGGIIDVVSSSAIRKVDTDNEGQMKMEDLKAGTYYLKETRAPEGYSLNDHIYKVEIIANLKEGTTKGDGILESWEIKVDNVTVQSQSEAKSIFDVKHSVNEEEIAKLVSAGYKPITEEDGTKVYVLDKISETNILNTKITNLPSTGGIGTTIFTIAGCLIMILAAALFFASRRKSSKQ